MSEGTMAGQLLASPVTGARPEWAGVYERRRLWSTLPEAPALLKQQVEAARHFVGDRARTTHVDSVAELAAGSGAVVRVEGRRCAVCPDEDGTAHTVSARGTHLGCLVSFNQADTAWKCPCHGSRFGIGGEVLHGTALRPLSPRRIWPRSRSSQPAPTSRVETRMVAMVVSAASGTSIPASTPVRR